MSIFLFRTLECWNLGATCQRFTYYELNTWKIPTLPMDGVLQGLRIHFRSFMWCKKFLNGLSNDEFVTLNFGLGLQQHYESSPISYTSCNSDHVREEAHAQTQNTYMFKCHATHNSHTRAEDQHCIKKKPRCRCTTLLGSTVDLHHSNHRINLPREVTTREARNLCFYMLSLNNFTST